MAEKDNMFTIDDDGTIRNYDKKHLHVDVMSLTNGLRWNKGVLEQAWKNERTGEIKWEPVPQIGDEQL